VRYILSKASRRVLECLANRKTLCAFDFDGTLAPIVARPERARIRVRTRKLLQRLAFHYPCVILSGRARADLLGRLDRLTIQRAIGNHGAELFPATAGTLRRVARWKAVLDRELGAVPGVWIEDKGASLSIHYRAVPARLRSSIRKRVLLVAQSMEGVRVFGGKLVVNLAPDDAPHKGDALAAEQKRLRCEWVLYVGDDETDEDAFGVEGKTITVRVGRKQGSKARYYLHNQGEIDQLLELLLMLRITSAG
jgi:trehalose 6-phosphate phosphatase